MQQKQKKKKLLQDSVHSQCERAQTHTHKPASERWPQLQAVGAFIASKLKVVS